MSVANQIEISAPSNERERYLAETVKSLLGHAERRKAVEAGPLHYYQQFPLINCQMAMSLKSEFLDGVFLKKTSALMT